MANQPIVINGTSFKPSSIAANDEKIGDEEVMANAKTRYYHRGFRNVWEIEWIKVPYSVVSAVRAIFRTVGTFTFIDENSASWTVTCLPGAFNSSINAEDISLGNVMYYNVSLTLTEMG